MQHPAAKAADGQVTPARELVRGPPAGGVKTAIRWVCGPAAALPPAVPQ